MKNIDIQKLNDVIKLIKSKKIRGSQYQVGIQKECFKNTGCKSPKHTFFKINIVKELVQKQTLHQQKASLKSHSLEKK